MSDTRIYSFPESAGGGGGNILGYLAPLMKQSGLDPNMVFAMMNNGRNNSGFGDGAWFLWIIVILALFRGGLWGGNGNGASEAAERTTRSGTRTTTAWASVGAEVPAPGVTCVDK